MCFTFPKWEESLVPEARYSGYSGGAFRGLQSIQAGYSGHSNLGPTWEFEVRESGQTRRSNCFVCGRRASDLWTRSSRPRPASRWPPTVSEASDPAEPLEGNVATKIDARLTPSQKVSNGGGGRAVARAGSSRCTCTAAPVRQFLVS